MSSPPASTKSDFFIKIAYFTSLAGASFLFGFSVTLNKLRKNTPETPEAALHEEAVALARKALMRGTLYSIFGFGVVVVTFYQFIGKNMIKDFNLRSKKNNEEDLIYLQNLFRTSRSSLTDSKIEEVNEKKK